MRREGGVVATSRTQAGSQLAIGLQLCDLGTLFKPHGLSRPL